MEYTWLQNLVITLNNNEGVIAFLGFITVIPFAFFVEGIISGIRSRSHKKALTKILVKELWVNMNFVAQIEASYRRNLAEERDGGAYVPHYPPRTDILEKYIEYNFLNSLEKNNLDLQILEIYSQLKELKREFNRWRIFIANNAISEDRARYEAFSSTILSYIKSTMLNMITVWSRLIQEGGDKSDVDRIRTFNKKLLSLSDNNSGYVIRYKIETEADLEPNSLHICWSSAIGDREDILELKKEVPLHDSWNKRL